MVGTDRFARRVATSLLHGEVLPCKVVGFVHLPDQEIAVEGPVYELDQIPIFSNGNSINDVVIALPAATAKRGSASCARHWRSYVYPRGL